MISHGFIKQENKVPQKEIDKAREQKQNYQNHPSRHQFKPE
ncbi:MAG: hypothetical protein HY717_00280 [Planctomycetes bacterium]|nr:hypothetical protein [Planctomycetota bacterium]